MSYLKSDTHQEGLSIFLKIAVLAAIFITASLTELSVSAVHSQDRTSPSQQHYSFVLTGIPLVEALDVLITETDINLFYESEMVEGKTTFCSIENRPIENILLCVLRGTELDFYQLSSGMYVLVNLPKAEAKFGALAGLVLDAHTGEPLPDASVLLAYAETGTATNTDGRFALSQLNPGLHPIIVTHVAYEDLYDSLYVDPGAETSVRYAMSPRTFMTTPIVIDGLQERVPSEQLATRTIDTEELLLDPSPTPSTHVALNNVVGVGGGEAFADIHVQGGDSGEHLYALDGIPVFVPIRNGGFFGAFSPLAVNQITVHKAGFDASEGSYLAGVVDITHELTTSQETLLDVQIDALSANGRLQGSLDKIDNIHLAWMVTGRIGLWELFQPGPIEQQLREWSRPNTYLFENLVPGATADTINTQMDAPVDIRFSDIHAGTRIRIGGLRSLYLSMYQGHNAFGGEQVSLLPESIESRSEDYRWSNKMRQARYEWVSGHKTFLHIGLWSSDYELIHPADRFPFSPGDTVEEEEDEMENEELEVEDFNQISEVGLKVGFDTALGSRHTLSGSLEPILTKTKFSLSVDPSGETDPITHLGIRPARTRIQSFLQDKIALNQHTQVTLGSRFTYIPAQQRLYAEPRLSIRHDLPDGPGGAWALFGAVGLYRQFLFQFDVSDYNQTTLLPGFRFWIPLGEDERASSAYHTAAGLLYIPAQEWKIRLEGYYKHQPQLAVLDYINKNGIRSADGYAYGGGLSITYDRTLFRFQAQYEYGQAYRRTEDRFSGRYVGVPWNAPHQLNATLDLRIVKGLMTTVRWQGIYNRTWAYRQAYYDYIEPIDSQLPSGTPSSIFSSPSQHILRTFSQIDAGISYELDLGRLRVQARLNMINIGDRKNVFDWIIEQEEAFQRREDRHTTPFYSTASLRVIY